jgi:hypothetical protein
MAYIAPSLWAVNEYGAALRKLLHRTRQLERWIDFKSFQVFEEAITYTALQFFTHAPNETVKVVISPEGEMGDIDWTDETLAVPSAALRDDREWLMATGEDREVIERLARDCLRLDDKSVTSGIIQGLVTSADPIFHLEKKGTGRYICAPKGLPGFEVELEDKIMKLLVSGSDAKRYEVSLTNTFLLFPYFDTERGTTALKPEREMKAQFPKAWAYLKSWEKNLRGRENSKMDRDKDWWGYVYPKSLGKNKLPKLVVPRLVIDLSAFADDDGKFYLDNVDVGGVIPMPSINSNFLLAALNGPVANFVFRRISKPFQNGYWSANKQFIAPLPIPHADAKTQKAVGAMAKHLQERWTSRRDLLKDAAARLSNLGRKKQSPKWLWPDLPDIAEIEDRLPKKLMKSERAELARIEWAAQHEARIEALQGLLDTSPQLVASFAGGELKLASGGAAVFHRIYLDDETGPLAAAYWQYLALSRKARSAKTFAANLCSLPIASDMQAAIQFMKKIAELHAETETIRANERNMNERLYELYKLSAEERILIEKDCAQRPLL